MERDEFGFTKRDPRVLQRAQSQPADVRPSQRATYSPKVTTNGDFNTTTVVGVVKGHGGGSATMSPETGSHQVNAQRYESSSSNSVARDTLNIPNVIEYHHKRQQQQLLHTSKSTESDMRTDQLTPLSSRNDKKSLVAQLSRLSIDNNVFEGSSDLPQVFQVKYLGAADARGLWGIKHTRKPVDAMVAAAKSLPADNILPLMKCIVSTDGVTLLPIGRKLLESAAKTHAIETISYGVQDLVYTRVFSMIVVRDTVNFRRVSPFECHGFVCESKHHARQLTYALATAFQIYSQTVKTIDKVESNSTCKTKRFAIDLRTPDEIETDLQDSEA